MLDVLLGYHCMQTVNSLWMQAASLLNPKMLHREFSSEEGQEQNSHSWGFIAFPLEINFLVQVVCHHCDCCHLLVVCISLGRDRIGSGTNP